MALFTGMINFFYPKYILVDDIEVLGSPYLVTLKIQFLIFICELLSG